MTIIHRGLVSLLLTGIGLINLPAAEGGWEVEDLGMIVIPETIDPAILCFWYHNINQLPCTNIVTPI